MARRSFNMTWILTLLVGAFLMLDGIAGLNQSNSLMGQIARAFGTQGSTIALVIAIVELVAGALLLLSLFVDLGQLDATLGIVIAIAWIVIMVFTFFLSNFNPDSLIWWRSLVQYTIILAVIWMVKGGRA